MGTTGVTGASVPGAAATVLAGQTAGGELLYTAPAHVVDFAACDGDHFLVVSLVAEPSGEWVAGYASGRVVHWDASGASAGAVMELHHVFSLAVEQGSGRVAVACDDGYVIIHPVALDSELFAQALGSDRIVRALFGQDGRTLVTASRGGSVRRTEV